MSAVPVYTESPITAIKADGVTPKTSSPAPTPSTQRGPAVNLATTTVVPSTTGSYPAAKPGVAAMPAPTAASQRYVPLESASVESASVVSAPTPTRKTIDDGSSDNGPPAPQPGAFPTAPSGMRANLPPPPKAGEKYQTPSQPVGMPQPYPRQMNIPPPTTSFGAQPPRSSTSASTTPSVAYPVPLPSDNYGAPRRSLEHPPGYIQDNSDSKFLSSTGGHETNSSRNAAESGLEVDGVWNTAKSWATSAGKLLSKAENDVWKSINGEK